MPSFPDEFLAVAVPVHIVFGAIGAFVLCPLAFFLDKASRWHALVGRLMLIDVYLVSISGTALLLDPLFVSVYWADQSNRQGVSALFESAHYPELFFLLLAIVAVYLAHSGARIWKRIDHGRAQVIGSTGLDWALSLVMGAFCLLFATIGVLDLIHADIEGYALLATAALLGAFVAQDLYTFLRKPAISRHRWWLWHMTRLTCAWAGLVHAFWLRLHPYMVEHGWLLANVRHSGLLTWGSMLAAGYLLNRKRFSRSPRRR